MVARSFQSSGEEPADLALMLWSVGGTYNEPNTSESLEQTKDMCIHKTKSIVSRVAKAASARNIKRVAVK